MEQIYFVKATLILEGMEYMITRTLNAVKYTYTNALMVNKFRTPKVRNLSKFNLIVFDESFQVQSHVIVTKLGYERVI